MCRGSEFTVSLAGRRAIYTRPYTYANVMTSGHVLTTAVVVIAAIEAV